MLKRWPFFYSLGEDGWNPPWWDWLLFRGRLAERTSTYHWTIVFLFSACSSEAPLLISTAQIVFGPHVVFIQLLSHSMLCRCFHMDCSTSEQQNVPPIFGSLLSYHDIMIDQCKQSSSPSFVFWTLFALFLVQMTLLSNLSIFLLDCCPSRYNTTGIEFYTLIFRFLEIIRD